MLPVTQRLNAKLTFVVFAVLRQEKFQNRFLICSKDFSLSAIRDAERWTDE